jgi:excisionase family DNA binding protein
MRLRMLLNVRVCTLSFRSTRQSPRKSVPHFENGGHELRDSIAAHTKTPSTSKNQKRKRQIVLDGRGRPITRLTSPDDLPQLVTVFEAAAWLGVHTDVIRSMIAGGALPEVRFGRLVRTTKAALVAKMTGARERALIEKVDKSGTKKPKRRRTGGAR